VLRNKKTKVVGCEIKMNAAEDDYENTFGRSSRIVLPDSIDKQKMPKTWQTSKDTVKRPLRRSNDRNRSSPGIRSQNNNINTRLRMPAVVMLFKNRFGEKVK
jgi:hypothetical protein